MHAQELAGEVFCYLAEGMSLRASCDKAGLAHSTFLTRCDADKQLADQYADARARGRALRFERLREVAASPPERDEKGKIDLGWVAWKKMEIDTEKWSLAREDAKRYGDKIQQEHSGSVGVSLASSDGGIL